MEKMNEIIFAGRRLNLDQPASDVINDSQNNINYYFQGKQNLVVVEKYDVKDNTVSIKIKRKFVNDGGVALGPGLICDKDASLLTGIRPEYFSPISGENPIIMPLLPGSDGMFYTPISELCKLWKHQIKTMASTTVKKIIVCPTIDYLSVELHF